MNRYILVCVCVCGGVILGERVTQVIALPKKLHPSMSDNSWTPHLWSLAPPDTLHLLSTLTSNAAGAGLPTVDQRVGQGEARGSGWSLKRGSVNQGMLTVLVCEGLLWVKPQLYWFPKDNSHVMPGRQSATPRTLLRKGSLHTSKG